MPSKTRWHFDKVRRYEPGKFHRHFGWVHSAGIPVALPGKKLGICFYGRRNVYLFWRR